MPLQIRRGTDAERQTMTVPLAAGELLYVTDTQRIYVGNGTALGGVAVTGYTNEDAQDAAASLLTSGTHSGITFTYSGIQDAAGRIDAAVDLSSYSGTISGDLTGSVYGTDTTLLVDGTNSTFNLDGTIKGNIVPDADSAYDLGSSSFKFKDLYLSGSSIHLGNAVITSTGTAVDLPLGSTLGGVPIGSGGSDVSGNIIGDDSTVIVNTNLKSVTAAGGLFGTLTGNVFTSTIDSTDSTAITVVPSVVFNSDIIVQNEVQSPVVIVSNSLILEGNLTNGLVTIDDSGIYNPSSPTNAKITLNRDFNIEGKIINPIGDLETTALFNVYVSNNGTDLKVPDNAPLYGQSIKAHNGVTFVDSGAMAFVEDGSTTTGADSAPAKFILSVGDGVNDLSASAGTLIFDKTGTLTVPVIQTGVYTSTPETRPSGVKGMIIFNDTTSKFQGFDGSAWVNLN